MGDFDDFDLGGFDIPSPSSSPSHNSRRGKKGRSGGGDAGGTRKLYWPLTLMSLLLVSGLSFLMAYLTKDVANRSIWLLGLIFMVPVGAMFLSALLVEFRTGAMTPAYTRKPQVIVAIAAVVMTFVVGCLCNLIYQQSLIVELTGWTPVQVTPPSPTPRNQPTPSPTPRHSVPTATPKHVTPAPTTENAIAHELYSFISGNEGDNFIFVVDCSISMDRTTDAVRGRSKRIDAARQALSEILKSVPETSQVGAVFFQSRVSGTIQLARNTSSHQTKILNSMNAAGGGTNFVYPIKEAIRMFPFGSSQHTSVIMLTDGQSGIPDSDLNSFIHSFNSSNASMYVIYIDNSSSSTELDELARRTKGRTSLTRDLFSGTTTLGGGSRTAYTAAPAATATPMHVTPSPTPKHVTPSPTAAHKPTPSPTPLETPWVTGSPYPTTGTLADTKDDYDILRVTGGSANGHAKWMTFLMLLLEGLTIGIGLSLMLSVSGQKRWQLLISPIMAVLAWGVLKMVGLSSASNPNWWLVEGGAFSLLGVVFMTRFSGEADNDAPADKPSKRTDKGGNAPQPSQQNAPAPKPQPKPSAPPSFSDDDW